MLSGVCACFGQPTVRADELQQAVIFNISFLAARAAHPCPEAHSRCDQANLCFQLGSTLIRQGMYGFIRPFVHYPILACQTGECGLLWEA